MLSASAKKHIDGIISAETGVDPATVDIDKPIRDQVSLDSMQFIGLIARIEIELGIELPIAIIQVSTLQEFYDELSNLTIVCGKDLN